jgi:3'(2'), 5'-bisphosphate nucleotidase
VPVLGVVYTLALNEMYFASKETGSFKLNTEESLNVSDLIQRAQKLPLQTGRTKYTVVASRSHMSPETEEFIKELEKKNGEVETISKGSSLKLCMVAEGQADCYPRFAPTKEWDTAAGQAICMYAGFRVLDRTTKHEMVYNRENLLNNWFLVK